MPKTPRGSSVLAQAQHLFAALVIGVKEILVILGGGEVSVQEPDKDGDQDERDQEGAIVNTEGLQTRTILHFSSSQTKVFSDQINRCC